LCDAVSFQHSGLALARYLPNHATKEEKKKGNRPENKLLESARQSEASDAYCAAFSRWKSLVGKNGYLTLEAVTAGSLAVGLGNESPLEVGLTIHHTYGMPVIPGSAVKGLCRRVAALLLAEKKIEQEQFDALFGKPEAAGCFVFHDAWYDPDTVDGKPGKPFHRDVVTVHHPKYYSSRGQDAWPTDFDDPIPVPFLVVRPGARFLFAVECPSPAWKEFVEEALKHGLEKMGIGAKTNAGYGRFAFGEEAARIEQRVANALKSLSRDERPVRGGESGARRPTTMHPRDVGESASPPVAPAPAPQSAKSTGKSGAFVEWVTVIEDDGSACLVRPEGSAIDLWCKDVPGRYQRLGDWDGQRFKATITYENDKPVSARWKSWR